MLGPSPDWIVGVSGLEMCRANCSWVENKELFLYPWDAGVDSGISYESPDSPSEPKMPITRYDLKFLYLYSSPLIYTVDGLKKEKVPFRQSLCLLQ